MALFSERYGYTKPSDMIIREQITPEIQNAICSCFDGLQIMFINADYYNSNIECAKLEQYLWTDFLRQRESKYRMDDYEYKLIATPFIENSQEPWYRKLDLIECTIQYLCKWDREHPRNAYQVAHAFINRLNGYFEHLNFGYRIINQKIIEITSKEEIAAIEAALQQSQSNIRMHLSKALELYAQRPSGDYRNSIKESISAVEAFCREQTNTNTLGNAFNSLQSQGIMIPFMLREAFVKLYAYTNLPATGIRHALMDADGTYTPGAEEALFMLVSCSAFINYLRSKITKP